MGTEIWALSLENFVIYLNGGKSKVCMPETCKVRMLLFWFEVETIILPILWKRKLSQNRLNDLPKVIGGEAGIKIQAASLLTTASPSHSWASAWVPFQSPLIANPQILIANPSHFCLLRTIVHSASALFQQGPYLLLLLESLASPFSWAAIEYVWQCPHLMFLLVSSTPDYAHLFENFKLVLESPPSVNCIGPNVNSPLALVSFLQTPSWCLWCFPSLIFASRGETCAALFFFPSSSFAFFHFQESVPTLILWLRVGISLSVWDWKEPK